MKGRKKEINNKIYFWRDRKNNSKRKEERKRGNLQKEKQEIKEQDRKIKHKSSVCVYWTRS